MDIEQPCKNDNSDNFSMLSLNSANFSIDSKDLQGKEVQKNNFFKKEYKFEPNQTNHGNNNKNYLFKPQSKIIDKRGFRVRINYGTRDGYEVTLLAGTSNNRLFIVVPFKPTLNQAAADKVIDLENKQQVEEFKDVCKKEGLRQAPLVYKSLSKY